MLAALLLNLPDRSPDAAREGYYRRKRHLYRQLQAELDYRLEQEAREEQKAKEPKRKRRARLNVVATPPVVLPEVRAAVDRVIARPAAPRPNYEAKLAELDAIAAAMAAQDDEDAIMVLML